MKVKYSGPAAQEDGSNNTAGPSSTAIPCPRWLAGPEPKLASLASAGRGTGPESGRAPLVFFLRNNRSNIPI